MASGLGELVIELGTIGDTKQLEAFVKKVKEAAGAIEDYSNKQNKNSDSIKNATKGIASFVIAITGAIYALNRMTDGLVKSNQNFINLTRQSDIALTTFQKWDSIGKMFGIEGAANQLESLNEKLFELRLTGEGARGFQLAGINPIGQNAEGVLEQLRARISGMDNTTAGYLLKQMGLDPRMITLLRMSRTEFEELGATINKYQLNDEQRADIEKMNIQLQIANTKLRYLKDRILLKLMPMLVNIMKSVARIAEMFAKFANWLTSGTVKSRAFILSIAAIITKFKGLRKIFLSIGEGLAGMIAKIPILGRLFGGLGKVVSRALLPFMALFYILDDLATYFEGGDSVIGRILNWGSERGSEIGDAFKKMFGGDLGGGTYQLADTSLDIINDTLNGIKVLLEMIVNFFTLGLFDKFKSSTVGKFLLPSVEDLIGPNPDNEKLSLLTPDMTQSIDNSNSSTSNNTSNSSTSNNTNNVNLTAYITTNQPAQEMMNEYRHLQAAYGIG